MLTVDSEISNIETNIDFEKTDRKTQECNCSKYSEIHHSEKKETDIRKKHAIFLVDNVFTANKI